MANATTSPVSSATANLKPDPYGSFSGCGQAPNDTGAYCYWGIISTQSGNPSGPTLPIGDTPYTAFFDLTQLANCGLTDPLPVTNITDCSQQTNHYLYKQRLSSGATNSYDFSITAGVCQDTITGMYPIANTSAATCFWENWATATSRASNALAPSKNLNLGVAIGVPVGVVTGLALLVALIIWIYKRCHPSKPGPVTIGANFGPAP